MTTRRHNADEHVRERLARGAIGVVGVQGRAYVEAMLDCLEKDAPAVLLNAHSVRSEVIPLRSIIEPRAQGGWIDRRFSPRTSGEPAMVAFTSGTTGEPKGIVLSHENLADVVDRLNATMRVDDSIREYVGTPVYHSFAFGRCRAVLSAGGRVYLPSNGFDPREIAMLLRTGRINALSMVPTLARILLENRSLFGPETKDLHWIELGSQSMRGAEKAALRSMFPKAVIVQHYGLTEASRTTFLSIDTATNLETVGRAVGRTAIKIDDTGCIQIAGPHVSRHAIISGEIVSLLDDSGWLKTNDLGRIDNGDLTFLGRSDDVINCGGIKINPERIEQKIYQGLGIHEGLAVARIPDALRGESVFIAMTTPLLSSSEEIRAFASTALAESGVQLSHALSLEVVGDDLPRTSVGKIKRSEITRWYIERPGPVRTAFDKSTIGGALSAALNTPMSAKDTFVSLGGDSLSFVQASVDLQRLLGRIPVGWENMTLDELEKISPKRSRFWQLESSIALRALAILSVLNTHIGFGWLTLNLTPPMKGGTHLLSVLMGQSFARFNGRQLVETGSPKSVFAFLFRIYVLYAAVVVVQDLVYYHDNPTSMLLLYSAFTHGEWRGMRSFWFVEAAFHIYLLFVALLMVKPLRAQYARRPFDTSLAMTLIALGVGATWVNFTQDVRNSFGVLWMFTFGVAAHHAKSTREKLILSAILVTGSWLAVVETPEIVWLAGGGLAALWIERISVPPIVARGLTAIASASLMIYLSNPILYLGAISITHRREPEFLVLFALFGGVVGWHLYDRLIQIVLRAGSRAVGARKPTPQLTRSERAHSVG